MDITINGINGIQAVNAINGYLSRMPALRPLILATKSLLEQHGLHSAATGGLSSYAVTCMVISFLQVR
jgi:non-canonical poly(A) RNA polymerase PAPD5/7